MPPKARFTRERIEEAAFQLAREKGLEAVAAREVAKSMGMTGGYIVGFLISALIMWAMEAIPGSRKWVLPLSMVLGLIACYAFGTAWFLVVYTRAKGAISLAAVLGMCVIPYIIPDIIKIVCALVLTRILKRFVK